MPAPSPKPGFATSEFWLTLVWTASMVFVAVGLVPAADQADVTAMLTALAEKAIALVAAAIPVVQYVRGRLNLKAPVVPPAPPAAPEDEHYV